MTISGQRLIPFVLATRMVLIVALHYWRKTQPQRTITLTLLLVVSLAVLVLGPHDWIADLAEWIHQPRDYRR